MELPREALVAVDAVVRDAREQVLRHRHGAPLAHGGHQLVGQQIAVRRERRLDRADPDSHASLGRLANGRDIGATVAFDPGPGGSGVGSLVTFDLAEFNKDMDGYNARLMGVLNGR